jgi:hypothetical protein
MDTTPEAKLLDLIKKDRSRARTSRELKKFTKINIALIGIIILIVVIFLADVFVFKKDMPEVPALDIGITESQVQPVVSEMIEEDLPDLSTINQNPDIKRVSRQEVMANLNLLGIIKGDNNQAIIEDKNLNKTFFLYKGDSIGDLTVYEIKDNAVILENEGEKIELNM